MLAATGVGGNLVNDAHIAALAVERDATVVTFDSDFGRYPRGAVGDAGRALTIDAHAPSSGRSRRASTCRGRNRWKWRRSSVASLSSPRRSTMANTQASTKPMSASA